MGKLVDHLQEKNKISGTCYTVLKIILCLWSQVKELTCIASIHNVYRYNRWVYVHFFDTNQKLLVFFSLFTCWGDPLTKITNRSHSREDRYSLQMLTDSILSTYIPLNDSLTRLVQRQEHMVWRLKWVWQCEFLSTAKYRVN